jgi:LPXTG-motif cell wall-anchored protein
MDGVGLTLLGIALVGGIGALARRRRRERRLHITDHDVRCPLHDCQAQVAVRTDPRAQSCQQYVDVTTCSLLSDAAIALPERTAHLADFPPYPLRLDVAPSYPVYASEVRCPQHCVIVLNEAAVAVASQPVEDTSGADHAIELAARAVRNPRIARLLWYYSAM